MEFYDKLVDRFQDLSKADNLSVTKPRFNYNYLELSKENEEYGAVTLIMLYFKVLHMVPQNS